MKHYVLGYALEWDHTKTNRPTRVLLIKKNRPDWQVGLLNGVGGKIEEIDKTPIAAMVREFCEETGVKTSMKDWNPLTILYKKDVFKMHIFTTTNIDLSLCKSTTDEIVNIYNFDNVVLGKHATISNIPWILSSIIDPDFWSDNILISYSGETMDG